MATAICQICQQEFVKRNGKQIYCGGSCYKEARRRQSHTPEQRERARKNKQQQRDRDPEHQREILRKSRGKHREQRLEETRRWFERNPGYTRAQSRKWRAEHPESKSQEGKRYYAANREKVAARISAYTKANPDVLRVKNSNRRALLKKADGKFTRQQFKELCEQVDYCCAYCYGKFDELTPDHITPLSRGGSNDISNIIPACGPCNYSKQDKTPLEYLTRFRI